MNGQTYRFIEIITTINWFPLPSLAEVVDGQDVHFAERFIGE